MAHPYPEAKRPLPGEKAHQAATGKEEQPKRQIMQELKSHLIYLHSPAA